jgi:hypothetical protein
VKGEKVAEKYTRRIKIATELKRSTSMMPGMMLSPVSDILERPMARNEGSFLASSAGRTQDIGIRRLLHYSGQNINNPVEHVQYCYPNNFGFVKC